MPFDGRNLDADFEINLGRIDAVIAKLDDPTKWCKGALYIVDRSHRAADRKICLLGALQEVPGAVVLKKQILEAARQITGHRFFEITSFNDRRATSHADVMAVLRRTRESLATGALARPRNKKISWFARLSSFVDPRASGDQPPAANPPATLVTLSGKNPPVLRGANAGPRDPRLYGTRPSSYLMV
jgi:hypothetical protein